MESQDRKPRKRREREEIGGQVLANNLIGEIDRLEKVGEQAERTAAMYGRMFEDIKSTVLKVDTAPSMRRRKSLPTHWNSKPNEFGRLSGHSKLSLIHI